MVTTKQVEKIAPRKEKSSPKSKPQTYHVFGTRHVKHVRINRDLVQKGSVEYEKDPYSQVQNFLYKRAILGLKLYTPKELKDMAFDKQDRVRKVHKRTQTILNLWKQELTQKLSNEIFLNLFPESPFTKALVEESDKDSEFKSIISLRDLGISKAQIIAKLHAEGILPSDFYSRV